MRARSRELVDKSVAAMIAAIEIYNKPDFKYREETFAIIALNAWELLLKAKWLAEHGNRIRSLYVMEKRMRPGGKKAYKHLKIKLTGSKNPFTHSIDWIAKKLHERGTLTDPAFRNLSALAEIRDSSVHFYNRSNVFAVRLQEVGSAAVRNFVQASQDWFRVDLTQYNFYMMPLAFVSGQRRATALNLTKEEKNVADFIDFQEMIAGSSDQYSVSVAVEVTFKKSKASDALKVQLSNDPAAPRLQLSEEQLRDRYPLDYRALTKKCKERYADFVENRKYHGIRAPLKTDKKFCFVRRLDPDNERSPKTEWFSEAIFTALDKFYTKRV